MKLTMRMVAALKRTAQNNYPLLAKKVKIQTKMAELQEELDLINTTINGMEAGSKAMTGGFTSLELIDRVVVGTGKIGPDGKEVKTTKYVVNDRLVENEDGTYEINVPEVSSDAAPCPCEEPVNDVEESTSAWGY